MGINMTKEKFENTTSTATTGSDFSLDDFLDNFHKVKAEFDRIDEKMLKSAAKVAEIECPTCHRKVTVINGGGIVACKHIIAALRDKCDPALPKMPLDQLAIKVFLLDDGPARFRCEQFPLVLSGTLRHAFIGRSFA